MSEHSAETGAWWTEFPGSGKAAWSAPSPPPSCGGLQAPARDGLRGAVSRRAVKHGVIVAPGKRERARREALAQRRRRLIAAIGEPSLKSGVITVGSGFGGTGKTDVAVTLAAIYAAARPADRVILADSNDDMPHGYIRLGGMPVEGLPAHQRPLSLRGFYQACRQGRISVYPDLRDAVAWLQGVAVIRGDTADECAGVDFGEQEYQAVLEFLQCMSNIVINDGGTGLFAKLQVGTLLHADKYVFVTEASQLGSWSIGQVFRRYRNYAGEKDRPLTEPEKKHLTGLMDEATVVVDKFAGTDPEQAKWYAQICDSFTGTHVSVAATPWDHALANRVPLDLGAVAAATLDAKLAMADVVLRSADRANRRRHGLLTEKTADTGNSQPDSTELSHWLSEPVPPEPAPDGPEVRTIPAQPDTHPLAASPATPAAGPGDWPQGPDVRIIPAQPAAPRPTASPATPAPAGPGDWPEGPDVRIIPAQPAAPRPTAGSATPAPAGPGDWPEGPDVRIIPFQPHPDTTGPEPGIPGAPDGAEAWPDGPDVRIIPAQPPPDTTDAGPDIPGAPDGAEAWPDGPDVPIIPAQSHPDTTDVGLDILGPPDGDDAWPTAPAYRSSPGSPSRTQPTRGWTFWRRRRG
jgi:MinD-like ATPase involved in chromosome partitioning or flagellar assembly